MVMTGILTASLLAGVAGFIRVNRPVTAEDWPGSKMEAYDFFLTLLIILLTARIFANLVYCNVLNAHLDEIKPS